MAWPVSKAAAAVLASGNIGATLKVEVWNGNTYLQDIPIVGGTVNEDETANPRRNLTVTVADTELVPQVPTDLLHPLSGNEIRPYWGIVIPGKVTVTSELVDVIVDTGGLFDAGDSWDAGGSWDDDISAAVPTAGVPQTTYDSSGTFGGGTSFDDPTPVDPTLISDDTYTDTYTDTYGTVTSAPPPVAGETWDSGTSWDSGTEWDSPTGIPPTTQVVTSTVTEAADVTEWVPLGVFRMTQPSTTYNGASTVTTINGHDRSKEISLRTWTFAFTIPAGLTVDQAIVTILNNRWANTQPQLTYNMTPTSIVVPTGTVLGVDFTSSGAQSEPGSGSGNDPWADCVSLAQSVGCELFFDRQGIVVMRVVPDAATVPVTARFVDGQDGTLVNQVVRELDETTMVNQVIMIGTGATVTNTDGSVSPGAPVTATASYMDPILGINGVFGARTSFVTNSAISDVATCQVAANAALNLGLASLDDTSFEAVPNPTVEAGDADQLTEPAVKADGTYIVSAITFPLDVSNPMQVTNRASSVSIQAATTASSSSLPDMVVSQLDALTGHTAGDSVQFSATILNQGDGPTPTGNIATVVTFAVDGAQVAIADRYSQVIAPGGAVQITSDSTWTATAGDHMLTATVNPGPQYPEADGTNNTAIVPFTVTAAPPATGGGAITWTSTANPPAGALNVSYTTQFQATNATNFQVVSGELPVGLTLSSTGQLSGTPTTSALYQFSIAASNSTTSQTAGPFTLNVTTPYTYSPAGTYTTWYFRNAVFYNSLQWVFTPVQDAPASLNGSAVGQTFTGALHYYAMQFYVENATSAQGGGYAGFQTNGNFGNTSQGKVINFSIWGSTGGNSTNGATMINAQNVESGGFQMMLRYNWTVGHSYQFNLTVGPGGVTSAGTWWALTVTDQTTATATYVGQQLIPNTISGLTSSALQGTMVMFGEDTHWWQSTTGATVYPSPTAFQNSAMACTGVTTNGSEQPTVIIPSTSTGATTTGSNGFKTTNAMVTEYVNSTSFAVQHNLGYWATPAPNTVAGTLVY